MGVLRADIRIRTGVLANGAESTALVEAHVRLFRRILDSDLFPVSPDSTRPVGKDVSGKPAFQLAYA